MGYATYIVDIITLFAEVKMTHSEAMPDLRWIRMRLQCASKANSEPFTLHAIIELRRESITGTAT